MYNRLRSTVIRLTEKINRPSKIGRSQAKFKDSFMGGERIDEISLSDQQAFIQYLEEIIKGSGLFDAEYYLTTYKDVARSGVDPLKHFLLYGGHEARNPSTRFNCGFYMLKNPDVKARHLNPLIDHLRQTITDGEDEKLLAYSEEAKQLYTKEFDKGLRKVLDDRAEVVVMESMPWEDVMQQRPHHMTRLLAQEGIMMIYIDRDMVTPPRRVADNLYLVPNKTYYHKVAASSARRKYVWLYSTQDLEYAYLQSLKKRGFELLYDFIDDIHPTITGKVENQLENYRKLKQLKPKILLASARTLQEKLKAKFPDKEVLFCANAVDLSHFSYYGRKPTEPTDMLAILQQAKPIVGYYGAIAPWLDYELINDMTLHRKDVNFVFIGVDFNGGLPHLDLRDNVHFLGAKDYKILAQYSYWFDCAIIPFKRGEIAKSTSPVKLFEYMAMAVPVVCTRDLLECYGYDHVFISKSSKEFLHNIDRAIKLKQDKNAGATLIKQAEFNTWQARARDVAATIREVSK